MNQCQQELLRELAGACRAGIRDGDAEFVRLKPGQGHDIANLLEDVCQQFSALHQGLWQCLAELVQDYELIAFGAYHVPRETPGAWRARWSAESPEWFDIVTRGRSLLAAGGVQLPLPHEGPRRTPRGASPGW